MSALRSGRDPLAQFSGQLNLPGAPESAQAIKGLESLRGWRRLHIRLTLLYGGTTLLPLLLLAFGVYPCVPPSPASLRPHRRYPRGTSPPGSD